VSLVLRAVDVAGGHTSALATGRWQLCLDLNAEIAASQRERGTAADKSSLRRSPSGNLTPQVRIQEI
jgi:hypothetical protein